ncbi:DUF262 domain-containing protein [Candidatus Chloroploca sp. M-50]|uniref:DUF262 domain-containing protein n=1 Tax=Candidatus Chloroploca mongolica TaxID=2528176 RepID=A0ABS4DE80_9CHLR|nr:DUF262 domain-containing protein [Candidatus Chloroploca mongolica]MBP1467752.1 DUF262 domain-containing protein [Candidatus Chloroploca mongolica]
MHDTQSRTESLLDTIRGIQQQTIMLPEFQRDFRWELDRTYDLFDSLVKEIFIGTIIYGKPSFGMTLREIDTRPRKGKGSNRRLTVHAIDSDEMKRRAQTENLRIVLDGQQRITALYRAITGIDEVYCIVRDVRHETNPHQFELEAILEEFAGEERSDAISVRLVDAYTAEIENWDDEQMDERFAASAYARQQLAEADPDTIKLDRRIYRRTLRRLIELYKRQKMVAFYLLDMTLEKFCLFFERSNSRGIQLNFIDILAAKLYSGFNLRKRIEEFETQTQFQMNREVIVRTIAFIRATERGGQIKIDRSYILEHLEAADFQRLWDEVCTLYASTLRYLDGQHFILAQNWMPSENMLIPLMIFLREIGGGFDRMSEEQRAFVEFWYWASVFANRYSTATNEVIITDSQALTQIAHGQPITARGYFRRLRSLITEPTDLYSYTRRASLTYRGVLNLLAYNASGLHDWSSTQRISLATSDLDDHHIYPRAYIASRPELDMDNDEAEQLVDCVANRTLIPKRLNIRIGKRSPHDYLDELRQKKNTQLADCLASHLIPAEILDEQTWDGLFGFFVEERAKAIFALIEQYAMTPLTEMAERYGAGSDIEHNTASRRTSRDRLPRMLADGRINVGDRVYVTGHPNAVATIASGYDVEYEGRRIPINTWGQQITGWASINIYANVYLERTGKTLESLRQTSEDTPE